jgi:hypothetical protein
LFERAPLRRDARESGSIRFRSIIVIRQEDGRKV